MFKIQCVECLKFNADKTEKCVRCDSNKLITEDGMSLTYQNNKYKTKEFSEEVNKLIGVTDNKVYFRRNKFELSRQYLHNYVIKNIKNNTFNKIYLPCIVALIATFIIFVVAFAMKITEAVLPMEMINSLFYFSIIAQTAAIGVTLYFMHKDYKVIKFFDENEFKFQFMSKKTFEKLKDNLYSEGGYVYFRPLETKRLIIRELNDDDINEYYTFFKNEKVHRFLFTNAFKNKGEVVADVDQIISDYRDRRVSKLAIVLKEKNILIGYIGLSKRDYNPRTAQIIYALGEQFWGQGYTPEAVSAFVELLIENGKTDIYATRLEENESSGKVLEKCGFIRNFNKDMDLLDEGIIKHVIGYSYPLGVTSQNEKN